ncbi:MAG: TGS domain-containing protein, partial [Alphaproteobacteria bacterium]|nr:TGS domain-containing protein [Alphaproteobacteria bacterium]
MINVTFPDQSVKQYANNVTGLEIAESISKSLAKAALFIQIDGKDCDVTHKITKDCNLRIITTKDPEALDLIRHDTAHILAEAVKELYPDAQITIGPS